ncbi:malonyl-S-ACP:biotin-protein carboxyltransferase MADD [Sideroxyarcus emersonii]|uniref:Malonyl-S-ACP:biotin-protein carboxyltransferase MADD n=1 Tax=Sideroxyarcus emersonii TaxID=2764705 RepID=A0AAN2BZR6_9PROT|nr:biotin-independent malonate decarboxylase subunit gamma [Sideroxyarcus emersonii]BCK88465.1 malonyl-S-ACP:biotin-protein carboxyltransferase MADD [Sideroxyarcus emersonii]
MNGQALYDRLFGAGAHALTAEGRFLRGTARIGAREAAVIGTLDHAAIDVPLALRIAESILRAVHADAASDMPPRPILFIADTQGQALSRHEELLGLNGYFAHVVRCVDLARRQGHRLLTVISGEAVSGGFLAYGMMADRICALPNSQVRVMDLRAMARVTKIGLERLEELAKQSPVFAPGAENYWRMGGIHELWSENDVWPERLAAALACAGSTDDRAAIGLERGGRLLAAPTAQIVANP